MVLQTSGAISLADIQAEFGGSNPISLNEYYSSSSGIPASGSIDLGDFYGASSEFAYTLTSTTQSAIIHTLALAGGWDGTSSLKFTIASGVYCWSDSVLLAGLSTGGPFPGGLTIVNNGYIMGRGGDNTATTHLHRTFALVTETPPSQPGNAGGPALDLSVPVTINNSNGYIGGGGGSGAGWYGGAGAGGGKVMTSHTYTSGRDSSSTPTLTFVTPASIADVPLNGVGVHEPGTNNQNVFVQNNVNGSILQSSGGGGNGGGVHSLVFYL